MRLKEVKVTTTSGFDGIEIKEYLEPVTAHVVVGMNIFKDLLGGLTDIFGGKSKTMQNTLSSINDEVIKKLKEKAFVMGGNCVLNLRIDNDEISAQGKSMMMVSAIGTVAIAKFGKDSNSIIKSSQPKHKNRISSEEFQVIQQKKRYLDDIKNNCIQLNDDFWFFAKNNSVSEFAEIILEHFIYRFSNHMNTLSEILEKMFENTKEYFLAIDQQISSKMLYSSLSENISSNARVQLVKLIKETNLINYSMIAPLLNEQDLLIKKSALTLCTMKKEFYELSDIELIEKLINLISASFNERGEKTTKKKALSSKQKEVWICECQNENNIDSEYCSSCKKDIYGFKQNEPRPAATIKRLSAIKALIIDNLE